eukprot:Rmarinus@m.28326
MRFFIFFVCLAFVLSASAEESTKRLGERYMKRYRTEEGVQESPTGLLYKRLAVGDGRTSPTMEDKVKVNYRGWTVDGEEFANSFNSHPEVMPMKKLVKGWQEILPKMVVGDKYELVIPPELAYGDQNGPRNIEPNSVLCFEIELLGFKPVKKPEKPLNAPTFDDGRTKKQKKQKRQRQDGKLPFESDGPMEMKMPKRQNAPGRSEADMAKKINDQRMKDESRAKKTKRSQEL